MNKDIYIKDKLGNTLGLIQKDQYSTIEYSDDFAHIKLNEKTILTVYKYCIELKDVL